MVVFDPLAQNQVLQPRKPAEAPHDEYATHKGMILENGPSPRHERTFVTRLHDINARGSAIQGSAVQGPIRFSKDKCGGANRNGAVFSPRNLATPPETDAEMSARQNERLRAAIAEARSARAKAPPRYRQCQVLGRPLPKEARSTPQPIAPALNLTASHIVGTVKPGGDDRLPVLPQVKVADQETIRRLRASAFAAFKGNSDGPPSGTRSERTAAERSPRRKIERISDGLSSSAQSERKSSEKRARRRRKRQQAAKAAVGVVSQNDLSVGSVAKPGGKSAAPSATSKATDKGPIPPTKSAKDPHPPPDPRFPPRPAEIPAKGRLGKNGIPAGASSWQMGKKHPAVPKEPGSAGRKPTTEPTAVQNRRARKQPAQMMSTVDRKTKLSQLEKQIGSVNAELLA